VDYNKYFHHELENDKTVYFILDTKYSSEGEMDKDEDFIRYQWGTDRYGLLHEGSLFIYRKPGKVGIKHQFCFFGAGKIEKIETIDGRHVRGLISKPFHFDTVVWQSEVENYKWEFRERKHKGWAHFFNQYGMNKITKDDFLYIMDMQKGTESSSPMDESEEKLETLYQQKIDDGEFCVEDKKGSIKIRNAAHHALARTVKANYNNRCAITGITTKDFLVASHIEPWAKCKLNRINPRNAICLSSLLDKAFDRGFISFDDNYKLIISNTVKSDDALNMELNKYKGNKLIGKKSILPDKHFLDWHRNNIFK